MKPTLAILVIIALVCVVFEIFCRIDRKREKVRFDKMTPEERFRYQNDMRKAEL